MSKKKNLIAVPKRGPGRPQKSEKDKRIVVAVRFSPTELEIVRKLAGGSPISVFIRKKATEG